MGGTMGQSITLANSIIGVGILAMPFCFQQCGILLATLILLFMGLVSRLCCHFLLKSAFLARRRNFEFLAFHVFGSAGKIAVEVGIIGFLMGTCIAYFVVVGDLGPQIISKMFNINQSDILRTLIMVVVSLVCVLPLGLLRNVDSLSNVSAATIGFYLCLVIKVIAEAASELPEGEWRRRVALWRPAGVLQCAPIFSMALFCQTQLFEIFESLPSVSLEKMNVVTKNAINICTAVYFTLGLFGYIAFSSQNISGNILMSLSPTMGSDVIKLGFVMSLAFSFPLIIFPCRASLYSFLYKKVHSSQHDHIINHSIPETTFRFITVGIIAVTLFISLLIPNIELVLGLVGSTIGVMICVVFPAACFVNVTYKNTNERLLAKGVLILGLFIMVMGTCANLQAAETQMDKYDERYITQEKIDKIVEDFFEKKKNEDRNLKLITKQKPTPVELGKSKIEIKKDSEVQPPNPVPPESNSNELKNVGINVDQLNINPVKNDQSVNDVLLPEKIKEEAADLASDTHPKNVKIKIDDAKFANGNTNNDNKIKEKTASEENKVEKIKLIKQQQLIETMKQHGEEQKELMQEQKEIFDEIIKNKKEIMQEKPKEIVPDKEKKINAEKPKEILAENPKETLVNNIKEAKPSNEVKADLDNKQQQLIETIKQHGEEQKELMKEQKEILDEIIKTKKELQQNKDDRIEAKKIAVESIKQIADIAIKSIGGVTEKPDVQQVDDKKVVHLEKFTNAAVHDIAKKAVETIEAIQEIKKADVNPADELKDSKITNGNVNKPIVTNIKNAQPQFNQNVLNQLQQVNIKKEIVNNIEALINNQEQAGKVEIINAAQNQIPNISENKDLIEKNLKPHSHSPDEPQSYKLGEDSQMKNVNNLNQNVPLALALSDQAKLGATKEILQKIPIIKENIEAPKEVSNKENIAVVRQKREVIDCTHTISLTPEHKDICNKIITQRKDDPGILPKVDLNDGLSRFPLDPMNHIGRSLKSFDETEKER